MRSLCFTSFVVLLIAANFCIASPAGREEWRQLRSKNFILLGNAPENDIRRVGAQLEEFREAFKQVFNRAELNSPIPTTVIVFKSNESYGPFKPRRADGSVDDSIAGYFMPGQDKNYITLATRGDQTDYSTIFHEYVHFIVSANYGRVVPPWFNEGLAEYYETFSIDNGQTVRLGLVQDRHLLYLKNRTLLPLSKLFAFTNYTLDQDTEVNRKVFYAQSWALVHYLLQAGKIDGFNKFLTAVIRGTAPEQAFQQAFQISFGDMEVELKKYITQRNYNYHVVKFPVRLKVDASMTASLYSEAEAKATLGDLLYHLHKPEEAVPFLTAALELRPDLPLANSAMGKIRIQQRRSQEARQYFEKAIAAGAEDFLAMHRYAMILSREDADEFGMVKHYTDEKVAKMRELLKRSLEINPTFTDSYDLIAFIALTNDDSLDEAARYMQQALKYCPDSRSRFLLRLAEIYTRQDRFDDALAFGTEAAAMPDDAEVKSWAEDVLTKIKARQAAKKDIEAESTRLAPKTGERAGPSDLRKIEVDKAPTAEEATKMQDDAFMRAMNQVLTPPAPDQTRFLGTVERIDCVRGVISYSVRSGADKFLLTSKDFQGLKLRSYVGNGVNRRIDCGVSLPDALAVITYKPATDRKLNTRGEMQTIEFVPPFFKFVDTSGVGGPTVIYPEKPIVTKPDGSGEMIEFDNEWLRRSTMIANIRGPLRRPKDGEVRDIGHIEGMECSKSGIFYTVKTATRTLRLTVTSPESLAVKGFTPDIDGLQITCGVSLSDLVTVFIYKDLPDLKKNTAGELVSLEFVPKTFTF